MTTPTERSERERLALRMTEAAEEQQALAELRDEDEPYEYCLECRQGWDETHEEDCISGLLLQGAAALLAERTGSIPCGVCNGVPLASGRECICGGVGTEAGEMEGLRRELLSWEIAAGQIPALAPETSDKYEFLRERTGERSAIHPGDRINCARCSGFRFWGSACGICAYITSDEHRWAGHPNPGEVRRVEPEPEGVPCQWTEDEDGLWATACGNIYVPHDVTTGFGYCPYCGLALTEVRFAPQDATGEEVGDGD